MAVTNRRQSGQVLIVAGIIITLLFFGAFFKFSSTDIATGTMAVTHIVLFQFKKGASPEDVTKACAGMLALKDNCIHPTSKKQYLLSVKGGRDISTEDLQNGITHGFVVYFASTEDRDYYVNDDPAHVAFKESISGVVAKAIVVDFTPGSF